MKPLDYRNATFSDIRGRLVGDRARALDAWRYHGPGTTLEVAKSSGWNILTFRPRTTELFQLGLLRLVDEDHPGHEGVYAALSDAEALALFQSRQREARREVQTAFDL